MVDEVIEKSPAQVRVAVSEGTVGKPCRPPAGHFDLKVNACCRLAAGAAARHIPHNHSGRKSDAEMEERRSRPSPRTELGAILLK
jgi:hypothetical protein